MLSESMLPNDLIRSIWNTIVRSFAETHIVTQYGLDSEIIILDEAFSQRCFTLFGYMEKKIPDEFISCYTNLAPISDHIFWIATSPQTCIERLKLRYKNKTSPYELASNELLRDFESGNNILKRLYVSLEGRGKSTYRVNEKNNKDKFMSYINTLNPDIWHSSRQKTNQKGWMLFSALQEWTRASCSDDWTIFSLFLWFGTGKSSYTQSAAMFACTRETRFLRKG